MEYGSSPPKILEYQARARRRRTLRKAITVLAIAASIIGYFRLTSYYLSFKHKRAKYHADFAKACDSLLINYPLGTNKYVEISAKDSSLPKMISDLHPERIRVARNKVWILVHGSHVNGLAVIWEPVWDPMDQNQTNTWALSITSGEGVDDTLYVTNRLPPDAIR